MSQLLPTTLRPAQRLRSPGLGTPVAGARELRSWVPVGWVV